MEALSTRTTGLTAAELERFARDGFLVLEGFATAAACDALVARAGALVDAFTPASASIFSTHDQASTSDAYFLASGDDVRFFFEEEAFSPEGELRHPKSQSINKIGHALHDLDPTFDRFSRAPGVAAVAASLPFADPRLIQSMYIFKNPWIGGDVACHQDATFLFTEPLSVVGFWFALEDATIENGCLWALPGGHRGPLRKRFVRAGGSAVRMDTLDETPFPPASPGLPYVALEAKKGTMVLLSGLLPHWSGANRSPRSRHAYAVHVIDGACRYPDDNWLRRSADRPARGF